MQAELSNFLQGVIGGGGTGLGYKFLIILGAIVIVFVVAFSLGKSKTLLALMGMYIAAFIASRLNQVDGEFGSLINSAFGDNSFIAGIVIFAVIYSAVIFIMSKSFLRSKLTIREASVKAVLLTGILSVTFLASIFVSYLPPDNVYVPSIFMYIFASPIAQLVWASAPVAAMVFLRKRDY